MSDNERRHRGSSEEGHQRSHKKSKHKKTKKHDKCKETSDRKERHAYNETRDSNRRRTDYENKYGERDEHKERRNFYETKESSRTKDLHNEKHGSASIKDVDIKTTRGPDITQDYEFEWEAFQYHLDRIFFCHDNFIRRGSQEHLDVWNFLKKYVAFQKKKGTQVQQKSNIDSKQRQLILDLPPQYDKLHRLNFSVAFQRDSTAIADMQGKRAGKMLTGERLEQFEIIILHYMDFVQKQKVSKLQKIKKDQQNLPIFKYKERIIEAVKSNQVVIVAGDTGCGKSTQVPQYLLAGGFEQIACTQPRRIACMSLSRRVSHETLNEYGSEVAYQVRFERTRTRATKILFLTEGLLLRQISSDPLLSQYSVVLIDEVHERHIHTDFLLGVVKCLLKQRADLKLVLMSATINLELFSKYFEEAPVISVPGRLYPIIVQYIPLSIEERGSKSEKSNPSPYLRVLQLIDHKYPHTERGDVLIFMSGLTEIMSVVEAARQYAEKTNRWIILPLHSALSIQEQDKVFDYPPEGVRKCIVSTNIAETSVTIDGIRFVVDSGKVKEMSFDSKYKMQRLQEFWISRASSEQRKGRAGRTGPGQCFRFYAESEYDALQPYSTPEIQRVPLDSLVLQMMSMGLANPRIFPFIEPPDPLTIENAVLYLTEQGALNQDEVLTPVGKMLAQLPVDVVIGKMLIMASLFQMVEPVLNVCAALSVQSPYTQKGGRDVLAAQSRKNLESEHGDPITLLNIFDEWLEVKTQGGNTRKWCRNRGLEEQRLYEMTKLKSQFKELLMEHGLIDKEDKFSEVRTHEERLALAQNRKRLRQLRHEQSTQSKKRKVLKMDEQDWEVLGSAVVSDGETEGADVDEDIGSTIKDLEFRLTNDMSKIQNESNRAHALTLKQMNVLKIILCSGLYPQVAIADEHNGFKSHNEQVFHTRNKGFNLLHPTCIYTTEPSYLEVEATKDEEAGADPLKGPISNKHFLLSYVSLLETQKPYLVGVMKTPALQTLLLFASQLDTNADSTRIVCDGWLEVCLKLSSEEAEEMLSAVVKLRDTWKHLVEMKLRAQESRRGVEGRGEESTLRLHASIRRSQRFVRDKLAEFLQCDVHYTLRRVLPAETARMYVGSSEQAMKDDPVLRDIMKTGAKSHPTKGGLQVNSYLVIGCLLETNENSEGYTTYLQRHWTCPRCGDTLIVTSAERLQHEQECQQASRPAEEKQAEEEERRAKIPTKKYHCDKCDKDFDFTTSEILKHRKNCNKPETETG